LTRQTRQTRQTAKMSVSGQNDASDKLGKYLDQAGFPQSMGDVFDISLIIKPLGDSPSDVHLNTYVLEKTRVFADCSRICRLLAYLQIARVFADCSCICRLLAYLQIAVPH